MTDHASHTPYSDPGRHRDLVRAVPTDPEGLSAVARNLIVHYRASGHELPEETRSDIDHRWLEAALSTDQARHPKPLAEPRPVTERVQGCCRDHTLFCVGVLREHGIPARSRVGFAGYFVDGWHHDHVIVQAWLDDRWRCFDPELDEAIAGVPDPTDMALGPATGRGFVTAAEAWSAHRRGEIDPETFGVDPEIPMFRGPRFLFDEVIYEIAHRFGDELLLWDGWGRMGDPAAPVTDEEIAWLDPIVEGLRRADEGDAEAEAALLRRYRRDDGLHPGPTVIQASPFGAPPIEVELQPG